MAYKVGYSCDRCGTTHYWIDYTVTYREAIRLARLDGWRVGKKGWFCPECKTKNVQHRRPNMTAEQYLAKCKEICKRRAPKGCADCPLFLYGCGLPEHTDIAVCVKTVDDFKMPELEG